VVFVLSHFFNLENLHFFLLIYTNKQENADKIIYYIELLIKHKYFNSDNLFFGSYHSGLNNDTQENIIKNFEIFSNFVKIFKKKIQI
jgi:hypothetical protein